jgi:hypothetical protein
LDEHVRRDLFNLWFFIRIIIGKEVIVGEVGIIIRSEIWGIASGEVRIILTIIKVYSGAIEEVFICT